MQIEKDTLSFQQQNLWHLHQQGLPLYSYAVVKITGPCDAAQLNDALGNLLPAFSWMGSIPGHILEYVPYNSNEPLHPQLAAFIGKAAAGTGDVAPVALRICRLEEHVSLAALTMHAMLADRLTIKRLMAGLFAVCCGEQAMESSISYRQYTVWQQQVTNDMDEMAAAYWHSPENRPQPELTPSLQLAPAAPGAHFGHISCNLPPALTAAIHAYAAGKGLTVRDILLTAFGWLLHAYTGEERVITGYINHERPYEQLAAVPGPVAKVLPVPLQVLPDVSFQAMTMAMGNTLGNAVGWEDYYLPPAGASPQFPYAFEYRDEDPSIYTQGPLQVNCLWLDAPADHHRLRLSVIRQAAVLDLRWHFDTAAWREEQVDLFNEHLTALLEYVVKQEDGRPLSGSGIAAGRRLPHTMPVAAANDALCPDSIVTLFEEQAARLPGRTAIVFNDTRLSYAALNRQANALAILLRERFGIKKGDIVGLLSAPSEKMIIAMLAVMKAGAAYLPIAPELPRERIAHMLRDAAAPLLITESNWLFGLHDHYTGNLFALDIELPEGTDQEPAHAPGPEDIAYVIYTSGSTGSPKGVMVKHGSLANYLQWLLKTAGLNAGDCTALCSSAAFDLGYTSLWGALASGAGLCIPATGAFFDTAAIVTLLRKEQLSFLKLTPTHFSMLMQDAEFLAEAASLRLIILGGEAIRPVELQTFLQRYPAAVFINHYGPTETTIGTVFHRITADNILQFAARPVIGTGITNSRIYLLDGAGAAVPFGMAGELCVGGPGLAKGYLNQEDLTREKFIPDPFIPGAYIYRTGDLARQTADGAFAFLGRMDQQLKIRGYRIEPGEIEAAIMRYPGIKAAAVCGSMVQGSMSLVAYVVSGQPWEEALLAQFLAGCLAPWMLPARYILMDQLPLLPNGKTDRKALPAADLYFPVSQTPYVAPVDEIEIQLARIWEEVLERDNIGVNDNFFDIGGHSLKAVQVVSRVHSELQVKMELKLVFDQPTIALQAAYVKGAVKEAYAQIQPIPEAPYYAVSHAQKRLWMQDQVSQQQTAYNRLSAQVFEGDFDPRAFKSAFHTLIERHEILRTTFLLVEGEPVQRVHPVPAGLEEFFEDLTDAILDDAAIRRITDQEATRSFDLEKGPLLHMKLMRTAAQQYVFLFHIHHIISDGWTMEVLANEVLELYGAYAANRPHVLQPLRIQYKDYACWHNQQLQGRQLERHRTFWLAQFADGIPVLELATDRPRPAVKTYNGNMCGWQIGKAELDKLHVYSREHGASLFMSLVAVLNVLLYRYTGQEDIVIGTPVAGRDHKDLENQLGFYVNTLALRTRFSGGDDFHTLLLQVKQHILEAYEHQVYPYDLLVDELVKERDRSRTPLFDVNLVLYNTQSVVTGPKDMQSEMQHVVTRSYGTSMNASRYDLLFHCAETSQGLSVNLEYNTDLFNENRMAAMVQHFGALLAAVVNAPSLSLNRLEYLGAEEKHCLLHTFNHTERKAFTGHLLHQLMEQQLARTPLQTAITSSDGESLTYSELHEAADRLSAFINREYGARPVIAAILLDNSANTMIAMLGILKAGGAFLPLDTSWPADRLRYIITDASAGLLVTEKKYVTAANKLQWSCPGLTHFICLDSDHVLGEEETQNELMKEELWDYVGAGAADDIEGGGWASSYTGLKFSRAEMDEYADNVLNKIKPYLHSNSRVLEIGCASGITMFRVAPLVAHYCGTDISGKILENTRQTVHEKGFDNISLHHLPAHEIDQADEAAFDMVIINSVIQSFNGYNYLRKVIRKAISLLKPQGCIFIGDIQDDELKDEMVQSLQAFQLLHAAEGYRTKTDWSNELFVPRAFWNDLPADMPEISAVRHSLKNGSIENELLLYRYDTVLEINKVSALTPAFLQRRKWQFGRSALAAPVKEAPARKVSAGDPAYIIYTSGSTGQPKGVSVSHNSICNYVLWACEAYFSDPATGNMALLTSTAFDLTLTSIFCPLVKGSRIYVCRQPEVNDRLTAAMANLELDTIKLTPTHISLLNLLPLNYTGIRQVIVGGEELRHSHIDILRSFNRDMVIYNEYGPTENTIGCTMAIASHQYAGIGKPVANTRLYILDAAQQLLPQGCTGEICTAGDCLAIGYTGRAALNDRKFIPHPLEPGGGIYRTGDTGRFLEDGSLALAGRIDDQVKIRGYRIELGEIEQALSSHPDITDAVVLVKESAADEKHLAAFIVPRRTPDLKDIRNHLSARLPAYMIPASFTELDALPFTTGGKVNKRKLLQLSDGELKADTVREMPRNPVERELAQIWEEVLHKDNIGIHDDFFDLGGHSLKATQVVSRIYKQLHTVVNLATIFNKPTIASLAAYIAETGRHTYEPVEQLPPQEHYAVSHAQQRLWIMDQLEDDLIAYNTAGADMICGELNITALETSLQLLLARHEILRTTFLVHEGELRQRVHNVESFPFRMEYMNVQNESDKEALLQEQIALNTAFVFDLANGPLMRVQVVQLEPTRFALLFCMHHIISDGWSVDILLRDFLTLYNACAAGTQPGLEPLRVHYKDYAAWQNRLLAREEGTVLRSFWLDLFKGPLPTLEIPADFNRPSVRTFNGNEHTVFITGALKAHAMEKVNASGGTLFMLLLSAVSLLLHYETEQEDLVIGTPIAGRDHKDLEDQIGLYANTLALRFRFSRRQTFDQLLAAVRTVTVGAYAHAAYPFDMLVEELGIKRDPSRSPLFDVMVVMQQATPGTDATPGMQGISAQSMQTQTVASKFDLSFYFLETADSIMMKVRYNTDLFRPARIASLCHNFLALISDALTHSEHTLADITARTEEALTEAVMTPGLDFNLSF